MPATQAKAKVVYPRMTPKVKETIKADPRWENLKNVMYATWQTIGSDCISCCEEQNEKMNNAAAIETVLDANYMSFNEGKDGEAAEKYVEELDKTYGYKAIEKFLNAEVRLY
jgi:hypothetical protein